MVYMPGDGTRGQRSRSGADTSAPYPELAGLRAVLGRSAALNGEIVALDVEERCDFERLQSPMGLASAAEAALTAQLVPAHLVLFDAVHLDGRGPAGLPYGERRAMLEDLGLDAKHRPTPAAVVGRGAQALEMTRSTLGTPAWSARSATQPEPARNCCGRILHRSAARACRRTSRRPSWRRRPGARSSRAGADRYDAGAWRTGPTLNKCPAQPHITRAR